MTPEEILDLQMKPSEAEAELDWPTKRGRYVAYCQGCLWQRKYDQTLFAIRDSINCLAYPQGVDADTKKSLEEILSNSRQMVQFLKPRPMWKRRLLDWLLK